MFRNEIHGLRGVTTCNPAKAVTLPNFRVPNYIGVPHRVTYLYGLRDTRLTRGALLDSSLSLSSLEVRYPKFCESGDAALSV